MVKRKKLPIGLQSFKKMIEDSYIYVDKTEYIYDLIQTGKYYFLLRPRRFGKSLLLSTFKELFSGNQELFEGLYIAGTDYNWKKHPVVMLSFSEMLSKDAQSLEKDIEWSLLEHAKHYDIDISDAPTIKSKLIALVRRLATTKDKVVVLVDEYDYHLINNINDPIGAEACRKVLHDFFSVFKDLGEHLRFIFVTGVTKFSKTTIFSGLNNLDDLTLMPQASLLLGYTHDELKTYFMPYLEELAKKTDTSVDTVLKELKRWYNGYVFSEESFYDTPAAPLVYNPFSVLLYFKHKKLVNYWAGTGTPGFLVHLIKTQGYTITQIEGSEVNIDETKAFDIDTIRLLPLLWQTGYLTIESYNPTTQNYTLRYPNLEVKTSFLGYFMSYLTDKGIADVKNYTTKLNQALLENNLETFFEILTVFFANIPYTMHIPQEKYYHNVFYMIFSLIGSSIRVEEPTNDGRIDAVIETPDHIYIFEFKLDESADRALKQIKDKQYYKKYLHDNKTITLIGANFNSEKRMLEDWKIEKIV